MKTKQIPALYDTIGENIANYRKMKGLTGQQLADALGLTYAQINNYEAAEQKISIDKLEKIATFIGTPVNFFLVKYGEAAVNPDVVLDKRSVILMQNYNKLEENMKEAVSRIVKILTSKKITKSLTS